VLTRSQFSDEVLGVIGYVFMDAIHCCSPGVLRDSIGRKRAVPLSLALGPCFAEWVMLLRYELSTRDVQCRALWDGLRRICNANVV
jgi:hypothetical protein